MEKTELTYSEQFFLLTIDPVSGKPLPVSEQVMHLSLAGALLLDASFRSMINDDWEKLTILKETDSVDSFLDEAIRCLLVFEKSLPLEQAVAVVAAHGSTLGNLAWNSLIKKGVIISRKSSIKTTGYKGSTFSLNMPLVIDINKKIREAVLNEDIPENAARNMKSIKYAMPHNTGRQLLDSSIRNNKIIFPEIKDTANLNMIEDLGWFLEYLDKAWTEVKVN